jgi:hypothetical protein
MQYTMEVKAVALIKKFARHGRAGKAARAINPHRAKWEIEMMRLGFSDDAIYSIWHAAREMAELEVLAEGGTV